MPGRVWAWFGIVVSVWAVGYWQWTQVQIDRQKSRILAKQRGVAAELSPRFDPLRDKLEAWTTGAAGAYAGDLVTPEAKQFLGGTLPGIYLRLKVADAASPERVRKAALSSLRDGFTTCLTRIPLPDPTSGPECKGTHDCPKGTFCNEMGHCTTPAQPYNLRAAYRGTRILTDEWTVDLRTASDDIRLRYLERELDGAVADDVPLAIDLLTRAQSFLLVLDEDDQRDAGADPEAGEGGFARVMLWGLRAPNDRPLLRMRLRAHGRFVPAGARAIDPALLGAAQRQVDNCQMAADVQAAIAAAGQK